MLDGKEEFDVNQHDARLKTTYPALRLVLLAATLFQTTGDVLFRSYSRRTLHETYTPASVLLVAEVMKLTFSFFVIAEWRLERLIFIFQTSTAAFLPATCYLVMNLLQYDALERLDAASFSVLSQLKVLTSALLSRWLLGRRLSVDQWRWLVVLVAGVTLIIYEAERSHESSPSNDARQPCQFPNATSRAPPSTSFLR